MARKYKRLNYEDRKAIEAMCKQGKRCRRDRGSDGRSQSHHLPRTEKRWRRKRKPETVQRRHWHRRQYNLFPEKDRKVHMKGGRI